MIKELRVGTLISGGGTNMQAIVNACIDGTVNAEVVFVGADNPDAKGLVWAKQQGIPTFVVDYANICQNLRFACLGDDYPDGGVVQEAFEKSAYVHSFFDGDEAKQHQHIRAKVAAEMALLKEIKKRKIDLLVLAGFMQFCTSYLIDNVNRGDDDLRIMNIHPALLPAFPGTDGYGDTIRYGCKVGGCTVHFVDYGEDSGPIIGQRAIPVLRGEDVDSFRKRGLQEEYKLYPECIQLFAQGRLLVTENGGRKIVSIIPPGLKVTTAMETHNNPRAI
ncbi:MAG: phosphoribosylglycinamide formyltransferase [Bacteroidales bacterium]|jgi:phosphoribosylglycinamide formyltransferase-1